MENGIYKISQLRYDEGDQVHKKLVGRILVQDGQLQHLESHHSVVDELLPEGQITPSVQRLFNQLKSSGYYEVVNEKHISAGHHPNHVQELDLGEVEADHKFIMTGPTLHNPAMIEMWDDAVVMDGRRLDDNEAHQLLGEVAAGRLVLTPID